MRLEYISAPNCIKHFHWSITLFWPIRSDVTIVSIGNNCNVKPDWPESRFGTVVKSYLISQNRSINQGNPLYNWVLVVTKRQIYKEHKTAHGTQCDEEIFPRLGYKY